MIAFRAYFNKLRSRVGSRIDSVYRRLDDIFYKEIYVKVIILSMVLGTVLTGTALCLTRGHEIADLAVSLSGSSAPQHRNQVPEPSGVTAGERASTEKAKQPEPLAGLTATEPTSADRLDKLCFVASKVASDNTASSYPLVETRKDCKVAKAALQNERTTACMAAVMDITHVVHSNILNIITKGAVAVVCNNQRELDRLVNNGTADNPAFPLFDSDYDGLNRLYDSVYANMAF